MKLPARPTDAFALFDHLSRWGEVAVSEVDALGAQPWIPVFENAGALKAVPDETGEPLVWHLTPPFVRLLDSDAQHVGRRLCFAVPEYRAYLLTILVEGLVDAAHAGMTTEIEQWTGDQLASLLPELNAQLAVLESSKRLVDLPQKELESRMADIPARALPFAAWDSFALGQSARPKALFDFALRRFAPLSNRLPVVAATPAVLRALPLNREDGFEPGDASLSHPWNTQRLVVLSGTPVVDPRGHSMLDQAAPLGEALMGQLQDMLGAHPFYSAVIHLAICAWRSPASTMPSVELYAPVGGELHDVSILFGAQGVGRLAELLGDFVRLQGYEPFGLVDGLVPNTLMANMLRNLIELRILKYSDELLVLDEDYQSSLMAARLRTVFRPGKDLQRRLIEELALRASAGGVS